MVTYRMFILSVFIEILVFIHLFTSFLILFDYLKIIKIMENKITLN